MQSSHPKPQLIVMHTHHDETVQNALELFEKQFMTDVSFDENVQAACNWLKEQ